MNNFTFYSNYYEIIKYLKKEDRLVLYDSIFKYMFDDEEPVLDGLKKGIWISLKMPLDNSKTNYNNGLKGGRPKTEQKPNPKPKQNRNKTEQKPNPKPNPKPNNISYFIFLISNFIFNNINNNIYLNNSIKEWLEYKQQRKEIYTEIGLKKLLTEIENNVDKFGAEKVIEIINLSMANNWKGIIFDKLKTDEKKPKWFNKEIQNDNFSDDEKKEFDELLKEFK